ncbi:hypothetical protein EVAR_76998_1 [Eumeta japonica]|uniref:AMP-dependent synthetase/ligase domain-containing protein n=1 Tax=Eumeta variegata TaxID=151549 RepID=A0A4C1SFJ8_EUMVA|nr:hypothetical protein EVAR_76998_1 [Eumeta japonica]
MAALADVPMEFKNRALSNYGSGDKYHLGHILLQSMADHPDSINQIDAATGQQETNAEVLRRSVRLARAMRARGLRPGDVLALAGPNHLDLCVPYYAAHYNGLPVLGIDPTFKYGKIFSLDYGKAKGGLRFLQCMYVFALVFPRGSQDTCVNLEDDVTFGSS